MLSIRKCKDLFDLEEMPDIERKLKPTELDDLPASSKPYLLFNRNKRDNEIALRNAERQRDESLVAIERNEGSIILPESIEKLKESMAFVDQLDYSAISAKIESEFETSNCVGSYTAS